MENALTFWDRLLVLVTVVLSLAAIALFFTLPSNLMRLDLIYGAF